ncbi:response regulator transcription factor [Puia sp. P3]|uniref:response regulator transcription factor n=1 Tax=Puia sp. P3 TaxID=3423952 RepID=UPI003D67678F
MLLVEDEIDLGNVVRQYLEISEFDVDWATDGRQAFDRLRAVGNEYQLALIDIAMPEMDGFQLADRIVQLGLRLPFLFLTARNEKQDRLHGLRLGADDYISKPFDIDELVLRIKNIIKRSTGSQPAAASPAIHHKDVTFSKEALRLSISGKRDVSLTPREAELLDFLFRNENRILKREEILSQLWGENDYFLGRSLDVFISRLRKHLSASSHISIDNVYGVGFVFSVRR